MEAAIRLLIKNDTSSSKRLKKSNKPGFQIGFDVSLQSLLFHWTESINGLIGWLFPLYQHDGMFVHTGIFR